MLAPLARVEEGIIMSVMGEFQTHRHMEEEGPILPTLASTDRLPWNSG